MSVSEYLLSMLMLPTRHGLTAAMTALCDLDHPVFTICMGTKPSQGGCQGSGRGYGREKGPRAQFDMLFGSVHQ